MNPFVKFKAVVVAPIVEEIIFRKTMNNIADVHRLGVLTSPLLFSLCHMHKYIHKILAKDKDRLSFDGEEAREAMCSLLVTLLFGCYASFIYKSSGSVVPCIFVHSMCNALGMPQITSEDE